jgi:hypothetical protein
MLVSPFQFYLHPHLNPLPFDWLRTGLEGRGGQLPDLKGCLVKLYSQQIISANLFGTYRYYLMS